MDATSPLPRGTALAAEDATLPGALAAGQPAAGDRPGGSSAALKTNPDAPTLSSFAGSGKGDGMTDLVAAFKQALGQPAPTPSGTEQSSSVDLARSTSAASPTTAPAASEAPRPESLFSQFGASFASPQAAPARAANHPAPTNGLPAIRSEPSAAPGLITRDVTPPPTTPAASATPSSDGNPRGADLRTVTPDLTSNEAPPAFSGLSVASAALRAEPRSGAATYAPPASGAEFPPSSVARLADLPIQQLTTPVAAPLSSNARPRPADLRSASPSLSHGEAMPAVIGRFADGGPLHPGTAPVTADNARPATGAEPASPSAVPRLTTAASTPLSSDLSPQADDLRTDNPALNSAEARPSLPGRSFGTSVLRPATDSDAGTSTRRDTPPKLPSSLTTTAAEFRPQTLTTPGEVPLASDGNHQSAALRTATADLTADEAPSTFTGPSVESSSLRSETAPVAAANPRFAGAAEQPASLPPQAADVTLPPLTTSASAPLSSAVMPRGAGPGSATAGQTSDDAPPDVTRPAVESQGLHSGRAPVPATNLQPAGPGEPSSYSRPVSADVTLSPLTPPAATPFSSEVKPRGAGLRSATAEQTSDDALPAFTGLSEPTSLLRSGSTTVVSTTPRVTPAAEPSNSPVPSAADVPFTPLTAPASAPLSSGVKLRGADSRSATADQTSDDPLPAFPGPSDSTGALRSGTTTVAATTPRATPTAEPSASRLPSTADAPLPTLTPPASTSFSSEVTPRPATLRTATAEQTSDKAQPTFPRPSVDGSALRSAADTVAAASGRPMTAPELARSSKPEVSAVVRAGDSTVESPGDAVLRSLAFQSAGMPVTAVLPVNPAEPSTSVRPAGRITMLHETIAATVSRVLVSDPLHDGSREVRMDFAADVLPDTSVRLWRNEGRLHVEFISSQAVAEGGLREGLPRLAESIQRHTREAESPTVTVRLGDSAGQPDDGRSRQRYQAEDDDGGLA